MGRVDCADTMIIRTKTRQELLYTRSKIAITAKAFGLEAIDMVSNLCPSGVPGLNVMNRSASTIKTLDT